MTLESSLIPQPIGPEQVQYAGKLFEVITQRMLIGSEEVDFETVRRPPGVRLIISSSAGNILLTREFRNEINDWDFRLPGGKVFDNSEGYNKAVKSGQDISILAMDAARKEALEETGIDLNDIEYIHKSTCGATVDWDLYYFTAEVPSEETGEQRLEAGENIQASWYSSEEVLNYLLQGKISEDRSAAVLFRYLHRLQRNLNETAKNENEVKGVKLLQLLDTAKLDSVRPRVQNLLQLEDIKAAFIVGSSFTGKSTLVDQIRMAVSENPQAYASISIPKRVITRPQRQNDNLVENSFATPEEFLKMIDNGEIDMHWVRKMEGDRTERYGFFRAPEGTLPIYSANNAIANNSESIFPQELLGKSLVIAIYAPEDIRRERLIQRSPDLVNQKPEEVAYRLSDRAANMYPNAHIIIKNFGRFQESSKSDIVSLIRLITEVVF